MGAKRCLEKEIEVVDANMENFTENGDKNVENAKEKVSECSVMDPEVQRKECDGGVMSSVEEFPTLQEVFNKGCELNSSNSNNSNSINVDNNSINSAENNVNSVVVNPYAQNIDNKLLEIPTVFEDGRKVVVFEEELGKHGLSDIVMQNGVYLFKFKNEEGMQFVLESGTWMVNNKSMLIQKWDPTVIIDKSDPKKLPL
ncbi:ATPase, F1/V1/A1 complex, alpha/beta subunit [Tanacetum coccineum]